ncbi:MAG: hypothetical protein IPK88_16805 [Saprospiraceae bacterium]|nr:hypothetical protein [Candidatus Defluviibacterium haderslevense]
MLEEKKEKSVSQFISNLCKGKTKVELEEAEQNFLDYLIVVKQIADRLELESNGGRGFDLSH